MVEPSADSATFTHEVIMVVAPNAASIAAPSTTFTVARGAAGTTAAAIADDNRTWSRSAMPSLKVRGLLRLQVVIR